MKLTDWIVSVWQSHGVFGIVYILLSFISLMNISAAVFLTMLKIEKADKTPKGIATVLYFVFTMLGLWAASELLH